MQGLMYFTTLFQKGDEISSFRKKSYVGFNGKNFKNKSFYKKKSLKSPVFTNQIIFSFEGEATKAEKKRNDARVSSSVIFITIITI